MVKLTTLAPPPDGDVILSNRFVAGIVVMTVFAVLIAWLRMYTRIFVSRNAGWDDWTMFAASVRQINFFFLLFPVGAVDGG